MALRKKVRELREDLEATKARSTAELLAMVEEVEGVKHKLATARRDIFKSEIKLKERNELVREFYHEKLCVLCIIACSGVFKR